MPRTTATKTTFASREEFEAAIDQAATLQLKLDADIASYNKRKAAEDKAWKNRVKEAKAKISTLLIAAEAYTAHHRDAVLGGKQTSETRLAFFGYRKSPGVIKPLNSKWTLGKALQALKDDGKTACVKVTESLNKQAVKSQIPEADLPKYGLRLDYPEEFGIEAKRAAETQPKKSKS